MRKLAEKIAKYITENDETADFEIIRYGMEIIMSSLMIFLTVTLVSLIIGTLVPALVFMIFFAVLRRAAGGLHAKSYYQCYIVSSLMSVAAGYLSKYIVAEYFYYIFALTAVVSIFLVYYFAPSENSKRPLSKEEKVRFRLLSRIVIVIELVVILVYYNIYPSNNEVYYAAIIAVILESLSLI